MRIASLSIRGRDLSQCRRRDLALVLEIPTYTCRDCNTGRDSSSDSPAYRLGAFRGLYYSGHHEFSPRAAESRLKRIRRVQSIPLGGYRITMAKLYKFLRLRFSVLQRRLLLSAVKGLLDLLF
jgi:hypothetical protein